MIAPAELSEAEYAAYEEMIASDARGRAFLRRRDAAARSIAVTEFRALVQELKRAARTRRPRQQQPERILWQELCDMRRCIEQTQSEIAALRPGNSSNNSIVCAATELDAIVSSIERATNEILHQAEHISTVANRLGGEPAEAIAAIGRDLGDSAMQIMLACSFQDLTGQRMGKVVNTLRYLERRVNAMIEIWGPNDAPPAIDTGGDSRPDAHLLNGPTDQNLCQDDVDALFADA